MTSRLDPHGGRQWMHALGAGPLDEEDDLKDTITCPWCYLMCESTGAYLAHKGECPDGPGDPDIPASPADRFEQLLFEIRQLHNAKRSDYTGDRGDILFNYRTSGELAGIGLQRAIFSRLCEKTVRLSGIFNKNGDVQVKDESIADTCNDLAVIALLLRIAVEEGDGREDS